jgi:hypothetical protein
MAILGHTHMVSGLLALPMGAAVFEHVGVMHPRHVGALVLAALMTMVISSPASAADEEWEFDGGGSGYGVGLSQYGARGQALDGRTASQILERYYTGAYVVEMPADHWSAQPLGLLVGLFPGAISVDLGAIGGPVAICQPMTECPPSAPFPSPTFADVTIDPGETWKFEVNGTFPERCRFRKTAPEPVGNLGWRACDAALTKANQTDHRYVVNGKEFAQGQIQFTETFTRFNVVVALSLEEYLYGHHMVPSSWPTEALRANAIMARSLALAEAEKAGGYVESGPATNGACGCHVRGGYSGWSEEDPIGGDAWVDAVDSTGGDILIHPRSYWEPFDIALPSYSLSNGGASESEDFVWGTEPQRTPWLRSVPDPWSADPALNPDARWTVVVPASKAKAYLGWDVLTSVEVVAGPPGAVVWFTGRANGAPVTRALSGANLVRFLRDHAHRRDGQQMAVSPYVIRVRSAPIFSDIDGDIFEAAIVWMAREGITQGCNPPANTRYCPEDDVTRGEMAVFLARAMDLPPASRDYFDDDNGRFYEGAANRLLEAGVTVGCGPGRFCGQRLVLREQMAAFLARALALPASSVDRFGDDDSSEFEGAINRIAAAGITLGCNPPANDRYCPTRNVTRGQMAAFFKRSFGN